MKISDLAKMSKYEIRDIPLNERRKLYTNLRRSVTQRAHTFERKGLPVQAPVEYRNMAPASELTDKQLTEALARSSSYYQAKIYTAAGYMEFHREQRQNLERKLGMKLTQEQYVQYKEFMDDAASRMTANWHNVSVQAVELFAQAQRLNLNVNQFKRNLDYWIEHQDQLQYAKPLKRSKGVKPSDYVRQLKLEGITSWTAKHKELKRKK